MNTTSKLSGLMISLHWLIALLMIISLGFGLYIEELPRSETKFSLIQLHKSVGILVLIIAAVRIINTYRQGLPSVLGQPKVWQVKAAKIAHLLLLAGTLFMPISGVMMSVGGGHSVALFGLELIASGEEVPLLSSAGHLIHGLGGKLIIAAVLLHIVAAFKHQFIDRDGTLSRMLGRSA